MDDAVLVRGLEGFGNLPRDGHGLRYGNRWSGSIGGAYTMLTDFPSGPQRNPNDPGAEDRSTGT